MLKDSSLIKVINKQKSDFWTDQIIENRKDDVEREFYSYLANGYLLYDVVAEGGYANLAGKTAGNYVCYFKNGSPSGTYTLDAAYFSPHTDVIVTGITASSIGLITAHSQTVTTQMNAGNYATMKYRFITVTIGFTGTINIDNFSIIDTNINLNLAVSCSPYVRYCTWQNVNISCTGTGGATGTISLQNNVDKTYENIYVTSTALVTTTFEIDENKILTLMNTKFSCLGEIKFHSGGAQAYLQCQNVYFSDSYQFTFQNIVYNYNNSIIYNDVIADIQGTPQGYNFRHPAKYMKFNAGKNKLDISVMTGIITSTAIMPCMIDTVKKSIRGTAGTTKRMFYQLTFQNQYIDDDNKYYDDQDYFIVWREDIETDFSTRTNIIVKIINFKFYKSDGTTQVTDYRNFEGFIILAHNGSNYVYFCWHKGELRSSSFADVWQDMTYIIDRVFNIFEMPEDINFRNLYNMTDSPIELSVLVQDCTSKVVL